MTRIDRVYVVSSPYDLRFAQCCVASIRYWYPSIPIDLVKDESRGPYSTRELEDAWDVGVFKTERPIPSGGWGKLEPLFLPGRQRYLILDSDIVFVGRVIDALEQSDADFVVESWGSPPEQLAAHYFDLAALKELDPEFVYPGHSFNAGQFVGTTGILSRGDFEPFVRFGTSPERIHPEVFGAGDQGILNYVLLKKARRGELTLERQPFMLWAGTQLRPTIRISKLRDHSPYPQLVHWAGPKRQNLWRMRNGRLLRHFEAYYYTRVTNGHRTRLIRSIRLLAATTSRKKRDTTKPPD